MTLGARGGLFKCQEGWRNQFSRLQRCCESRSSLIKGQETSRKQFSPLWGFCEVRASLLSARIHRQSSFNRRGDPVMHVEACINAHCGSSVKFVQAWLSARKHRESNFHHCGGSVKLL